MLRPRLLDGETLLVELPTPMRSLGTTVYGGGLAWIDSAIFRKVDKCFSNPSPQEYARSLATMFRRNPAVFLTAADVSEYIYVALERDGVRVEAIATVGLTFPACIGLEPRGIRGVGTINIFLATDLGLDETGITDLFRSVSEAKAGIISILGLSCEGLPAVGTVSDATVVAAPPGTNTYAGLGTTVGFLAASAVLEIIRRHMLRRDSRDYLRYMGLEGSSGHHGVEARELLIKRLSLLITQLRRLAITPWIDDESFEEIKRALENLCGRRGCGGAER
ncbi:MAG: adenosylcobinamide amidohydrolase [Sulfolobales archaeon]